LYGTTIYGGQQSCQFGCGTVFAVDAGTGAEKVLYAFSVTQSAPMVPVPEGLLYQGGQLFGTTAEGANAQCGGIGCGSLFKVNPKTGAEVTLHIFAGGADGGNPLAAPIYDNGLLYSTTETGGGTGCGGLGCGTIFSLDLATGAENVLFSFSGGITGADPAAPLLHQHGLLYTTTLLGVDQSEGGVITFNPATGAEHVLHSFTGLSDGALPLAGVTGHAGILYGTTFEAGSYTPPCKSGGPTPGCGTLFGVDAKSGAETVLHTFGWKDGSHPGANLIYVNGAFYGSTSAGGRAKCPDGCGTLFKYVP
jgi:uncharacterized repeat protein (TIGR03803 family)